MERELPWCRNSEIPYIYNLCEWRCLNRGSTWFAKIYCHLWHQSENFEILSELFEIYAYIWWLFITRHSLIEWKYFSLRNLKALLLNYLVSDLGIFRAENLIFFFLEIFRNANLWFSKMSYNINWHKSLFIYFVEISVGPFYLNIHVLLDMENSTWPQLGTDFCLINVIAKHHRTK